MSDLRKSMLEPERYEYLRKEDSALYDRVKDSADPKDQEIKRLLEALASASGGSHRASAY